MQSASTLVPLDAVYAGASSAPAERWARVAAPRHRRFFSAFVAIVPLVTAVFLTIRAIGEPVPWLNLILLAAFYFVIAHGVTIGFHRLFSHRSFEARRPLKIVLAVLGSMSFQGSLIGWVADHRRHHRYSDQPGDPHSPVWSAQERLSGWRGLLHAHVTWVFDNPSTPRAEFAPDLLADPDLVLIDRLFVPCCIATLALPFGLGYALTGTMGGALGALLWAGVLRVGIGHNLTWSVNSICHRFGTRPFRTRDRSTNFALLSVVTGGESWHNAHHAFPTLARHGVDAHQIDTSARLIRWFERLGWVWDVRWPDPLRLDARRMTG
jgi:stearoyl-CoA desaturase (delta-9 desaturase)